MLYMLIVMYPFIAALLRRSWPDIAAVGILTFWAAAGLWISARGERESCGLCVPKKGIRNFVPMVLLVLPNLAALGVPGVAAATWGRQFIILLGGVLWEELTFRGLLLKRLLNRYSAFSAVLMQSITFGVLHLVNLETYASPAYGMVQVIVAIGAGFWLGTIALDTGSIGWCVLIHTILNGSSLAAEQSTSEPELTILQTIVFLIAAVFCFLSGMSFFRKQQDKGNIL